MQLTSVSEAAILNSDYQSTSGNVGSVTGESGLYTKEGAGVEIVSPAHSVKNVFPLPVLNFCIHLEFLYSANVGLC